MSGGCSTSSGGEQPEAAWDALFVAEPYLFIKPPNHPFSVLLTCLINLHPTAQ